MIEQTKLEPCTGLLAAESAPGVFDISRTRVCWGGDSG